MKNQLSHRVFVLKVVNFNNFEGCAEIIDFDAAPTERDVCERLFFGREVFFGYAAKRASPIIGNIFESGAGCNAGIGVAYFGIVDVATYVAYIFFHNGFVIKSLTKSVYINIIIIVCVKLIIVNERSCGHIHGIFLLVRRWESKGVIYLGR